MERFYRELADGWKPETNVVATLTRIDRLDPEDRLFTIKGLAGSGFASRVYRAEDDLGRSVALKVYRPKRAKEAFRDLLHKVAWGIPAPIRYLESAVLISEGWHDILKRAVAIEGINGISLPYSYGHFFSPEIGSFVGVYEWIDGENEKPPLVGTQGLADYQTKRAAFRQVYDLAKRVGAGDRVRQWDWWTLVAPLNGKIVDGQRKEISMIDIQPGLPLVCIPLSPGDVMTVLRTLASGRLAYFDQPDFKKLDRYINSHQTDFDDLSDTVAGLKEADREYRDSLPAPLTKPWWRYFNSGRRQKMRETAVKALLVDQCISEREAQVVLDSDMDAIIHLAIFNVPLVGAWLHRVMFNEAYQEHMWNILTNKTYRHQVNLEVIEKWVSQERVMPERAKKLERSDVKVLIERPLGYLPRRAHRFLTDGDYRFDNVRSLARFLQDKAIFLGKFPFSKEARRDWLVGNIEQEERAGNLTAEMTERLYNQANDDRADKLIKDVLIVTLGFNLISWPVAIGLARLGIELHNEPLTFLALAQQIPLLPKVSIASILRSCYLAMRVFEDHLGDFISKEKNIHLIPKKYELANILLAATSPFGNAAAPLRMVGEMPELCGFLAGHFLDRIVSKIPVFGQRGTVTEALIYELFYNKWARRILSSQVVDYANDHNDPEQNRDKKRPVG